MEKLTDLINRRAIIEQGGGAQKVEKQHSAKKLTARERVQALLDEGSFLETDAFVSQRGVSAQPAGVSAPADGVVTGYGTIDGRPVCVYAQDFTVIGGSLGEMHAKKIVKTMDLAAKTGVPLIALHDSAGVRLQEGLDALNGLGEVLSKGAVLSGVVPQISVVMGPLAGVAACVSSISDFTLMVENTSHMFLNGPQVVKGAGNDDVTADNLGGAKAHAEKSGLAHIVSANELECLGAVKTLLSYLPDNNLSDTPYYETSDDINRISETLNSIVAAGDYDIRTVISEIADNNEFFELSKDYANHVVTGFVRLNGSTAGVVAAKGALCIGCMDKAARFVSFCDSYNIPVVTFTDVDGFLADVAQEHGGIIRHAAKLIAAYADATVPKVNIILGKASGGAHLVMGSKHIGADMALAWPDAEISVMASDGAANILFADEIASSNNPIEARQAKIAEYKEAYANPYIAAEHGYVDDVITPDSTRPRLIGMLEMLAGKRETRPAKKHGILN